MPVINNGWCGRCHFMSMHCAYCALNYEKHFLMRMFIWWECTKSLANLTNSNYFNYFIHPRRRLQSHTTSSYSRPQSWQPVRLTIASRPPLGRLATSCRKRRVENICARSSRQVTSFSCTAAAGDVMAQRESESTVPRFPPRPCLPPDSRPTGWTQWAAALGIVSHVTQLQSAEVRRDLRPNELLRIASRHRRLTHSVDFFVIVLTAGS